VRKLLVGDDFRFGARRGGDFALLKALSSRFGYTVEAMSSVTLDAERVSSTSVRDALAAGDLGRASKLLGRTYSISGRVVRGDGLGRNLGYPTANVRIRHRPALAGIFAVEMSDASGAQSLSRVRGVASLGVRPTVKPQGEPVLEVYALDFDGDLYGRHVRIDFIEKFRDEEKFADLAALTKQIAADVAQTRAYFERVDEAGRSAKDAGVLR
jgi:riboflavin kinase/FMN adenylyltransferase